MIALYALRKDGTWSVAFANADGDGDDTEVMWLCECKNPDYKGFSRENSEHSYSAHGETGDVTLLSQRLAFTGTDKHHRHPRTFGFWNPKRFKTFDAAKRFAVSFAKRNAISLEQPR